MKKILLVTVLISSVLTMVSCGDESESKEKKETEKTIETDSSDVAEKTCEKGMMCDSRKALEEELSDEEKTTIADARAKIKEVVGDEMYTLMAKSMCDGCCGKDCKKDSASCKKSDHADGGKKCTHGEGGKCCKHGHHHAMMEMMKDMDPAKMKEMHQTLMPTVESLVAISEAHADHFDKVEAHHHKMMGEKHEHMKGHHAEMEGMSEEMKAMHDEMFTPERMKQMMIVHYLLMDCTKCEKECKKSETEDK